MKPYFLFLVFLFSRLTFAISEDCKKSVEYWRPGLTVEVVSQCELRWSSGSENTTGLVYIALKDKCYRFEGGSPENCGAVISCHKAYEQSTMSIGIFDDEAMRTSACESESRSMVLVGHHTSIPKVDYKASLICQKNQLSHIALTAPDGVVKKCDLNLK